MRLWAATFAGLFAYLAAGLVTGLTPQLRWRVAPKRRSISKRELWLIQAGMNVGPLRFWMVSVALGALTLATATSISGSFWVALPPAVVMTMLPHLYYERRRMRRLLAVKQAWPDGLRHLVAAIRAGMSLPLALDDLASNGPDALQSSLARMSALAKMFGAPAALESVRDELADPTTDRVVEVLLVALERGGPIVPDILHDLAEATTKELRTVEEMRSESLEQRLSARIVFTVPWLVLLLMTARQGPYRDFYQSPAGFIVICVAAGLSMSGWWIVTRLARDPVEQRVLGSASSGVR